MPLGKGGRNNCMGKREEKGVGFSKEVESLWVDQTALNEPCANAGKTKEGRRGLGLGERRRRHYVLKKSTHTRRHSGDDSLGMTESGSGVHLKRGRRDPKMDGRETVKLQMSKRVQPIERSIVRGAKRAPDVQGSG